VGCSLLAIEAPLIDFDFDFDLSQQTFQPNSPVLTYIFLSYLNLFFQRLIEFVLFIKGVKHGIGCIA